MNREAYVARLVGGRVARERVVAQGLGSTDIDVIGPAGELITVGGPAKARSLSKWGMHLQRLKAVGKERGVRVMAYLEEGTPDEAIRLAKKWLGDENVMLFKWHEHP